VKYRLNWLIEPVFAHWARFFWKSFSGPDYENIGKILVKRLVLNSLPKGKSILLEVKPRKYGALFLAVGLKTFQ